jgi:hypothetical protein
MITTLIMLGAIIGLAIGTWTGSRLPAQQTHQAPVLGNMKLLKRGLTGATRDFTEATTLH